MGNMIQNSFKNKMLIHLFEDVFDGMDNLDLESLDLDSMDEDFAEEHDFE